MRLPRDAVAGSPVDLVVQAPTIAREDLAVLAALTDADAVLPLPGAATEAYRLHDIRHDDSVAEACTAGGYDWALVPPSRRRDRVRLVAMDMDSTLITIECIDEIADLAGIKSEVAAITSCAMRGEIDFRASLTRRVALLAGVSAAALEAVYLDRLALSPGAQELLDGFAKVGAKTLLVSGGFTAQHIPFKGSADSLTEVIAGRVDFCILSLATTVLPRHAPQAVTIGRWFHRRAGETACGSSRWTWIRR